MFLPFVCAREQQKNSIKRHGRENRLHYSNSGTLSYVFVSFPVLMGWLAETKDEFLRP